MGVKGSDTRDYDAFEWVEDSNIYECEDFSQYFSLVSVERSLREQGFEDRSEDYGNYFLALRYVANELDGQILEVRADVDKDLLEVQLGTDLSSAREIELHHSLEEGHIEPGSYGGKYGANPVPELVEKEEGCNKKMY